MTRRQRHNRVLSGITVIFLFVVGYTLLITRDFKAFLIGCGIYVVFLLIYSLTCWLEVPKNLRKIPDKPKDFRVVRLGEITESVVRLLDEAQIARDQVFGHLRHQLFRVERVFPEGIWSCEVEIAGERVLAFATAFESEASPVLDRGEQIGEGQFLVVLG